MKVVSKAYSKIVALIITVFSELIISNVYFQSVYNLYPSPKSGNFEQPVIITKIAMLKPDIKNFMLLFNLAKYIILFN